MTTGTRVTVTRAERDKLREQLRLMERDRDVIARGSRNSAMVEFIDSGQREVISRNALARAKR